MDRVRDAQLADLADMCRRVKTDFQNYIRIVESIENGIAIDDIPIPEFEWNPNPFLKIYIF